MMKRRIALIGALVVAIAACGGATEGDTSTTDAPVATDPAAPATTDAPAPTTTAAPEPTTTQAPAAEGEIPELSVGQALAPYGNEDITPGQVVVYWYRGANAGNYVVLYTGAGIAGAEGLQLCPGNSIATTQFLHISNTPSEDGACDGFPTALASLQVCTGGVWVYETAIPGDLEGTLFASLEWNSLAEGAITGLTSQTLTTPDMAEVAYGLSSYSIPPWYTSDGSSVITCDAPVS